MTAWKDKHHQEWLFAAKHCGTAERLRSLAAILDDPAIKLHTPLLEHGGDK
jgi:hypothetical protein